MKHLIYPFHTTARWPNLDLHETFICKRVNKVSRMPSDHYKTDIIGNWFAQIHTISEKELTSEKFIYLFHGK